MSRSAGMLFLVLVCWVPMRAPDAQAQEAAAPVTLTLQEVLRRAVQRAPEIALAHAQAERAVQAVRETRSANLPQVVTGTGLAYNNGFPPASKVPPPRFSRSGSASPSSAGATKTSSLKRNGAAMRAA